MDGERSSFAAVPASLIVEALEQRAQDRVRCHPDRPAVDRLPPLPPAPAAPGRRWTQRTPIRLIWAPRRVGRPGRRMTNSNCRRTPSRSTFRSRCGGTGSACSGSSLAPGSLPPAADLVALGSELAHEIAAARRTTDRYIVGARAQRLSLAAEMQWDMLPGRSCASDQFTLAGQLEPAYAVMGDTFDWTVGVDRLNLSVIDGMGEGVAAAALSSLANYALRNARRAGLSLDEQASMADSAIYAQHRGTHYVSVLLLDIDLSTGLVQGVDTGSPMLFRLRGDDITEVTLPANEPLGMFDGSHYQGMEFQLLPGDRLVIVSDGVHAATAGERRYAHPYLVRLLRRTSTMQPMSVVRTVVADLQTFLEGGLGDDAAVMCFDWHGPSR